MITQDDLTKHFANVSAVGDGVLRADDVVSNQRYFNYVWGGEHKGREYLVVSKGVVDDRYVLRLRNNIPSSIKAEALTVSPLEQVGRSFDTIFIAPPSFHRHFRGRLDEKRTALFLVIPGYRCEFVGDENAGEFLETCRRSVLVDDLTRTMSPKVRLRYHNSRTRGGTGDGYVISNYKLASHEVANLDGASDGFVEIVNYKNEIMEILWSAESGYLLIHDRNDSQRRSVSLEGVKLDILEFLTR